MVDISCFLKYFAGSPSCIPLNALVLYTIINPYTITFDSNGGTSVENQTKNYDETVATLVSYKNCRNVDGTEMCNAVYEYEVNKRVDDI